MTLNKKMNTYNYFFERVFQLIAFTPDDSSLLLGQDTNQFLVLVKIEPQISYTIIKDFTS